MRQNINLAPQKANNQLYPPRLLVVLTTACHTLRLVGVGSSDTEEGQQYRTSLCHRFKTYIIVRMKIACFLCQVAHRFQLPQSRYKNEQRKYCTLTIQNVPLGAWVLSITMLFLQHNYKTSGVIIQRSSGAMSACDQC